METSDKISEMIEKAMKVNRITGASISIVNDNKPVLLKHFGYADQAFYRIRGHAACRAGQN